MANIGMEPSEVMAAVAILMTPAKLTEYSTNGAVGLAQFIKAGEKLAKSSKVLYGAGVKSKALKAFNSTDRDFLRAAVQGISAARSIRDWVPWRSNESGAKITADSPNKVYLTGDSWPTKVKKFQVSAYGFKSYNSSDIILEYKNPLGLSFYGVSLKKKPSPQSPNPTLINKAFDSVLIGKGEEEIKDLNEIKTKIEEARITYFAKVFREAVREGYLKVKGSVPSQGKVGDKWIWDTKVYGEGVTLDRKSKKSFKWKAKKPIFLINLKGRGGIDLSKNNLLKQTDPNIFKVKDNTGWREFTRGEQKNNRIATRAFFNAKLGSSDSIFNAMAKVMDQYSDKFATALLNLVLKSKLYHHLDSDSFAFALITAAGDIDSKGNPLNLQTIKAKGLYTVLCGLSALNKGSSKYRMILNKERNKKDVDPETGETEDGAAKVWLILKKGNIKILDLQLKYKGNFRGQPQFGATITDKFKTILTEQYGKKCEVPTGG